MLKEEMGKPAIRRTSEFRDTVLIALMGKSPAVLTETLYGLSEEEPAVLPSRVVVVTTTRGRMVLKPALFGDGAWERFRNMLLRKVGEEGGELLRFGPADDCIRVVPAHARDRNIGDIRTREDHLALSDYLLEIVRGFTEDESLDLVVSIAGGRKTMGALMLSIMALYGRLQDRVLHVLVDEPWDTVPGFLYPGCPGVFHDPETGDRLDSRAARVHLADVPFIPLRYLFHEEFKKLGGGYLSMMESARRRVASLNLDLLVECDLQKGLLLIDGNELPVTPLEFAYYAIFLQRAADEKAPLTQYAELDQAMNELASAWSDPEDFGHWTHAVLEANFDSLEDPRKLAYSLRKRMSEIGLEPWQVDRLVPRRGRLSIDLSPDCIQMKPKPADRP